MGWTGLGPRCPLQGFSSSTSHRSNCNSCSTKCSSSSKWLWEQQLLWGEHHGYIPPANQEVRGRGACHSPSLSHDRLKSHYKKDMNDPYCALCLPHCGDCRQNVFLVLSVCLFLADKFVCNGCQMFWRTKTVSTIMDFFRTGSPTLKEP